jgi:hypothetical protein
VTVHGMCQACAARRRASRSQRSRPGERTVRDDA